MLLVQLGHVLLNEFWQTEVGDFMVDEERFPTMAKTIDVIHRRGFRIALSIQPYICTESTNFASAVKEGLLASNLIVFLSCPKNNKYH